ncbi:hypothetical protein ID866_6024 [Astraeus odoratus]|nr:hypothetical protein ID866_6024 [Astraeus odoratus]
MVDERRPRLEKLEPVRNGTQIAHNPPLLSISFSLSPKRPKDTRENIHATKEFTVSIISEAFVEAANVTSVEAPAEVNEWEISGLTMAPSVTHPRKLFHTYDIRPPGKEQVTHTLVLGLIKRIHVRSSVLTSNGTLDPAKLGAVSRLDGKKYARLGEGFELARPSWGDIRAEKQKRSDLSRVKE